MNTREIEPKKLTDEELRNVLSMLPRAYSAVREAIAGHIAALLDENKRLWKALTLIGQTPSKPFPHQTPRSWMVFGDAVYKSWMLIQNIADAALRDPHPAVTHPEDRCGVCGRVNPVWFAPNELWNRLVPERSGVLCPVCFMLRDQSVAWFVTPEVCDPQSAPEKDGKA